MKECRTVTFGIIAYNEQRFLPDLLEDLCIQTFPHELIEIIMVDGMSSDNTWKIMSEFKKKHSLEYLNIQVLKNEKRIQPTGWNIVIQNSTAEVILRIDAHARLPENFIEKSMECINSGEYVCGGPRENIIDNESPWKKVLLAAEKSMFGAGIASYRNDTKEKKYVSSVFHGAYRKEVFNKVGLFNEHLVRTEDNEIHYRIRKTGFKICYDPTIKSYYQTRNTLRSMLKQKYLNGLWIGKTLFVCPGCISVFHLVPFAFICGIIFTTALLFFNFPCFSQILWVSYGIVTVVMSITAMIQANTNLLYFLCLPLIFLLLHLSYGVGTAVGLSSSLLKLNNGK